MPHQAPEDSEHSQTKPPGYQTELCATRTSSALSPTSQSRSEAQRAAEDYRLQPSDQQGCQAAAPEAFHGMGTKLDVKERCEEQTLCQPTGPKIVTGVVPKVAVMASGHCNSDPSLIQSATLEMFQARQQNFPVESSSKTWYSCVKRLVASLIKEGQR